MNDDDRIEIGKKRRWTGLLGYALVYLAVAAVLVILLVKLSTSLALAGGIVAFMVGYMALMGYLASGKIDRRE